MSYYFVSGSFANLSSDFNPLVHFTARERSLHTIEFRYFKPDEIIYMQKRALIRRIGLFLCWPLARCRLIWFLALCLRQFRSPSMRFSPWFPLPRCLPRRWCVWCLSTWNYFLLLRLHNKNRPVGGAVKIKNVHDNKFKLKCFLKSESTFYLIFEITFEFLFA